jgi:6-pyruvoyltetrahydropterin/6-carboxytetrahydropterin synthase
MKRVVKTYGHERGLSACFRQWRAKSHCRFLHGYALAFTFTFECEDDEVDENGWVIDFGSLKPVKQLLDDTFDHKLLAAADDPARHVFKTSSIADLIVLPHVGCEAFAQYVAEKVICMLAAGELGTSKARLISVECREHGSNAAIWLAPVATTTMELKIDGNEIAERVHSIVVEEVARGVEGARERARQRRLG